MNKKEETNQEREKNTWWNKFSFSSLINRPSWHIHLAEEMRCIHLSLHGMRIFKLISLIKPFFLPSNLVADRCVPVPLEIEKMEDCAFLTAFDLSWRTEGRLQASATLVVVLLVSLKKYPVKCWTMEEQVIMVVVVVVGAVGAAVTEWPLQTNGLMMP
jgi:hypothetical protein